MRAYAVADETIRVPKIDFGPTRTLPQRFSRARVQRWPHVLIAVLAIVALSSPVNMSEIAARRAQANALLQTLGR